MAHYGLQAAVTAKTLSKRSPQVERAVLEWIYALIGEPVPEGVAIEDALKDGVALCKAINKLKPGSVNKVRSICHLLTT